MRIAQMVVEAGAPKAGPWPNADNRGPVHQQPDVTT